jgi:hypothetical protein
MPLNTLRKMNGPHCPNHDTFQPTEQQREGLALILSSAGPNWVRMTQIDEVFGQCLAYFHNIHSLAET